MRSKPDPNQPGEYARYVKQGLEMYRKMAEPQKRQGQERGYYSAREMGLKWKTPFHRAHSQSAQTGTERGAMFWTDAEGRYELVARSEPGILYAPALVNLGPMRQVENELARLYAQKAADTELWLYTLTKAWPGTRRLQSILYRCDSRRGGACSAIYQAQIRVTNSTDAPLHEFLRTL